MLRITPVSLHERVWWWVVASLCLHTVRRPLGYRSRCFNPPFRSTGSGTGQLHCTLTIGEQPVAQSESSTDVDDDGAKVGEVRNKTPSFELRLVTPAANGGVNGDSDDNIRATAVASTLRGAWTQLLQAVDVSADLEVVMAAATNAAQDAAVAVAAAENGGSASAPARKWRPSAIFGLSSPAIVQLFEGLEGAQLCSKYVSPPPPPSSSLSFRR